jgi:hypothetical protein
VNALNRAASSSYGQAEVFNYVPVQGADGDET